jgi:hypothetical protein
MANDHPKATITAAEKFIAMFCICFANLGDIISNPTDERTPGPDFARDRRPQHNLAADYPQLPWRGVNQATH